MSSGTIRSRTIPNPWPRRDFRSRRLRRSCAWACALAPSAPDDSWTRVVQASSHTLNNALKSSDSPKSLNAVDDATQVKERADRPNPRDSAPWALMPGVLERPSRLGTLPVSTMIGHAMILCTPARQRKSDTSAVLSSSNPQTSKRRRGGGASAAAGRPARARA